MRILCIHTILLFVLILVNLAIRIPRLDYPLSYIFAWGDGTRDFLVANHILTYGEVPLVGPFNLLNEVGIKNSPVYFYLLALILLPAKNSLTLSFVNILLQMSVIVLIYLIAKRLFNEKAGLIAAALFSFNPEIIKQADFVWQPHLMQPAALFAVYLFIRQYYSLSFFFLSLAAVLHNSAFSWMPLFLAVSFLFMKRVKLLIAVLFLSLIFLYSPLLLYYFKNPVQIIHTSSTAYITSISGYFINLKSNLAQFFDAFYLNNFSLSIFILVTLSYFAFIKEKRKYKFLLLLCFLFFISPFVFASFFNKIKLHYLYLSFSSFAIFVAAILVRFPKILMLMLAIFFIVTFSGNFAITKEFKYPLENLKKINKVTNLLVSELQDIKQKEASQDFNFFQIVSFAQSTTDLPYPILDTVLLVPLEEKLGVKLAKVSDQNPYNHFQTGSMEYLLVHCVRFNKSKSNCGDLFQKSYPGYDIKKTIYADKTTTIYLAKQNFKILGEKLYIIKMTKDGFEPSKLSIEKGKEVIFKNEDINIRWPASNIHPTHGIYPEFDPKKPIEPGQSWSFKPTKVGTWKYHDHLLPHIRGELVVVSESGELKLWQQNFKDFISAGKNLFIQKIIFKVKSIFSKTLKEDAAKRWQDLKLKYKSQVGLSGDIHDQAHLVGSLLYQEKGFLGIGLCSPDFAFGCFHGFLDEAFKQDLSRLNEAYDACSKLGQALSGPVASCVHGIGHGVASFYQTFDLNSALVACDRLVEGSTYCHDGVFMEFARNAPQDFYKADDPLFPCVGLDQKYIFSCGRNQSRVMMTRLNLTFSAVAQICSDSKDMDFQNACFDSLGFESVARSQNNTQAILELCNQIPLEGGKVRCIKSAAGELIFQDIPGWQQSSVALCQSLPSSQKECFEYIENIKREYGRS